MNSLPELINKIIISNENSLIFESHKPEGLTLIQFASNSDIQSLLNVMEWDLHHSINSKMGNKKASLGLRKIN